MNVPAVHAVTHAAPPAEHLPSELHDRSPGQSSSVAHEIVHDGASD
jgi:hypothetical protein